MDWGSYYCRLLRPSGRGFSHSAICRPLYYIETCWPLYCLYRVPSLDHSDCLPLGASCSSASTLQAVKYLAPSPNFCPLPNSFMCIGKGPLAQLCLLICLHLAFTWVLMFHKCSLYVTSELPQCLMPKWNRKMVHLSQNNVLLRHYVDFTFSVGICGNEL